MAMAGKWQVPVSQKPLAQSPSAVQLVLQVLPEQMKSPVQTCAAGETQEPALHVPWPTYFVPEQVGPEPQLLPVG
jgi:hypothetical protein